MVLSLFESWLYKLPVLHGSFKAVNLFFGELAGFAGLEVAEL